MLFRTVDAAWGIRLKKLIASLLALLILASNIALAADYPRNQSLYVTMRDDVKIAIDIWLPANLDHATTIPALSQATRYWRGGERLCRDS